MTSVLRRTSPTFWNRLSTFSSQLAFVSIFLVQVRMNTCEREISSERGVCAAANASAYLNLRLCARNTAPWEPCPEWVDVEVGRVSVNGSQAESTSFTALAAVSRPTILPGSNSSLGRNLTVGPANVTVNEEDEGWQCPNALTRLCYFIYVTPSGTITKVSQPLSTCASAYRLHRGLMSDPSAFR